MRVLPILLLLVGGSSSSNNNSSGAWDPWNGTINTCKQHSAQLEASTVPNLDGDLTNDVAASILGQIGYFFAFSRCTYSSACSGGRCAYAYNSSLVVPNQFCTPHPSRLFIAGGRAPACYYAYRAFDCCAILIYPCPSCPSGTYPTGCRTCAPCRNPLTANSLYSTAFLAKTAGTPASPFPLGASAFGLQYNYQCGRFTCPLGYTAQSISARSVSIADPLTSVWSYTYEFLPDGYATPVPVLGSCVPCVNLPRLNAQYMPQDESTGRGFCNWYCSVGYNEMNGACLPCQNVSTGARFYGVQGPDDTGCAWYCPSPFNVYDASQNACVSPSGSNGACAAPPASAALCGVGTYMAMDVATCSLALGCLPCAHALPGFEYYALNPTTLLSASAQGVCFTLSCPKATAPGRTNAGCAGSFPGDLNAPCPNAFIWSGTTPLDLLSARYFVLDSDGVSRCNTQPCAECDQIGFFNVGCPSQTAIAVSPGNCAPCAPIVDDPNAAWAFPWTRAIANANDCPYACNEGYTLPANAVGRTSTVAQSIRCVPCADSRTCAPGMYATQCRPPEAQLCTLCPASSGPPSGNFVWLPSFGGYGPSACRWQCSERFFEQAGACQPCQFSSDMCAQLDGFYVQADCSVYTGIQYAPSCEPCVPRANGVIVSPGRIVNDPLSCLFECNAGYFYDTNTASCKAWSKGESINGNNALPCPPGQYWGGGTATQDNACMSCPYLPSRSFGVIWQTSATQNGSVPIGCAWTCASGAFLNAIQAFCQPCASGAYKARIGDFPCLACPENQYQPSSGSAQCFAVPANAARSGTDGTNFACNTGYSRIDSGVFTGSVCAPCILPSFQVTPSQQLLLNSNRSNNSAIVSDLILGQMNLSYAAFRPDQCVFSAFSCNLGFYRATTFAAVASNSVVNASTGTLRAIVSLFGGACLPCETVPNALPILPAASSFSTAFVLFRRAQINRDTIAACGAYPACANATDEKESACPPATSGCQDGYYFQSPGRCVRCAIPPCATLGRRLFLCTGGKTSDTCSACPADLQPGQMWFQINSCTTACARGHARVSASSASCAQCPVGFFQPEFYFNASVCTRCSPGTYSAGVGVHACSACPPGTYSHTNTSTACLQCATGQYAPAKRQSACLQCPSGTFASAAGASACVGCPRHRPLHALPNRTACIPPSSQTQCPPGFYAGSDNNNNNGSCSPCPPGAFCPFNTSFPISCPPRSIPASGFSSTIWQCLNVAVYNDVPYPFESGWLAFAVCAAGQYAASMGTPDQPRRCAECAAGTYSSGTGLTACTGCPQGTYGTVLGCTSYDACCVPCPATFPGYWSGFRADESTGATACAIAPGFFDATHAATGLYRRYHYANIDLPNRQWRDSSENAQNATFWVGAPPPSSSPLFEAGCRSLENSSEVCALRRSPRGNSSADGNEPSRVHFIDFGQDALPPVWTMCALFRSLTPPSSPALDRTILTLYPSPLSPYSLGATPLSSSLLLSPGLHPVVMRFGHSAQGDPCVIDELTPAATKLSAPDCVPRATDWLVLCDSNGNNGSATTIHYNGGRTLTALRGGGAGSLHMQTNRNSSENAFEIAEILIWDRILPLDFIRSVAVRLSAYLTPFAIENTPQATRRTLSWQNASWAFGLPVSCAPAQPSDSGNNITDDGCRFPSALRCLSDGSALCCPPNTFFVEGKSVRCEPCPEGFFAEHGGTTACLHCLLFAPGTALPVCPTSSQTSISLGFRAPGQTNTPTACPTGTSTYGQKGASSAYFCYAAPGYYALPGSAALPCPYDAYCPPASTRPVPCPPSTPFANALATAQRQGCSGVMLNPCRPGFFLLFGETQACKPCPSACYCPGITAATMILLNFGETLTAAMLAAVPVYGDASLNDRIAHRSIMPCAPQYTAAWYSAPRSTSAEHCSPRSLPPANGSSGAPAPVVCPSNTHAPIDPISSSPTLLLFSTLQCRANTGHYFVPGVMAAALPCPFGYYCPADTLQPIPCNQPPSQPSVCAAYGSDTTPNRCPQGSGSPLPLCTPCPQGANPTPNGYYAANGSCQICCRQGWVKIATGASTFACERVPDSATCNTVVPNARNNINYYRPEPTECAASIAACAACPVMSGVLFPNVIGVSNATTLARVYANPLALSQFGITPYGPSSCVYTCPTGFCYYYYLYSSSQNGTGSGPMTIINSSFLLPDLAIHRNVVALGGQRQRLLGCMPAPRGSYANASSGQCNACPRNTYTAETGNTVCRLCPLPTAVAPAAGSSVCTCMNGGVLRGNFNSALSVVQWTCAPCPLGTVVHRTDPFQCVPCAPGTTCFPYQTSMKALADGTIVHAPDCPAGFFRAHPIAGCFRCPPGYISTEANSAACTVCPVGTYAQGTRCVPCAGASYGAQRGLSDARQCTPCPLLSLLSSASGLLSSADGTRCICPLGFFFDTAFVRCLPCAARCAPVNAFPALRVGGASVGSNATSAWTALAFRPACIAAPGVVVEDFECACRPGSRGDGYISCTRCLVPDECACAAGHYYNASGRICVPCRACPSIALQLTTCPYGAVSDVVDCACPQGYFYSRARNECFPCGRCASWPNGSAVRLNSCQQGARLDVTRCACPPGLAGDGLTCL